MRRIKSRFSILFIASIFWVGLVVGQDNSSSSFTSIQQIYTNATTNLITNNYYINNLLFIDSKDAGLMVHQLGYKNNLFIKLNALSSNSIEQSGQKNYFSFINYYNSKPSNFDVLQQGKGNSLQIYGSNLLMNNIKIIQKGNYKSLIIRNY